MADIEHLRVNGETYDISDPSAREGVEAAQEAADAAQSTADQAVKDAANAQSTADAATTAAATAQSTADQAVKDAATAQETADSATTAAATAQSTADAAQSTADEALETANDLYSDSIRPNVIRNTNDINELGSVGTWDAGTWRQVNQSGSARTSTRIDVDDAPDPHISCGVRCYTESGTTYAKIRQDGVPMEEGAYYTASFYARGSGQAQFQYGMSPYVATNFDVTDDWERYSVGFTFIGADCASTDGSTYIYFGTGSAATVEICGMMLEKWDEMTDWMPNPLDAKDITARETADSAASTAQEASDEISNLKDMSISTSSGSTLSAAFGFETIGIPRTLNDDGSYKGAFDTIKDYWEQLETGKVYIAFVNPQQQYVAIIQKYTGDHNYGSVFIQGYGFSTPRYYRISNGTWYEVTLADNASLTDGSVTKVGTSTVGGAAKPIYLSSGTPTACSSTVGSGTKPIYSSSGTLTASSSTVGSSTNPVYLNSGTITACSMSDMLTTGNVEADNITISGNSYASGTISYTKSGYTPLGVVGYTLSNASSSGVNSSRCYVTTIRYSNTNSGVAYQVSNRNTSDEAKIKISAYVLWLKTS